ncbi:MAG: sigma-E factor negative regulatory protein, partial [Rhizobiales bacterium]|nr:sigma-E factor negative regulatory protein [Rhizobacter sp.]
MLDDSETNAAGRESLSALLDGELDPVAVSRACAQWRDSATSRATWHAYTLIGDVLRSDDLAGDAARDPAFLDAFRARMAGEPVVLAPQPVELTTDLPSEVPAVVGRSPRRWSWMAP